MIKWCDNPYLDEALTPKWKKIRKKMEKEKLLPDYYCIAFPGNPENLLDIICVNELLFPYYKRRTVYIVGLAKSRSEAVLLVKEMVEDMYKDMGRIKPKEYFVFSQALPDRDFTGK